MYSKPLPCIRHFFHTFSQSHSQLCKIDIPLRTGREILSNFHKLELSYKKALLMSLIMTTGNKKAREGLPMQDIENYRLTSISNYSCDIR